MSGSDAQAGKLRADALGLFGTVSLTAAYMAPAASLVALFGAMTGQVGIASGFVMLLGLLITLPSAVSFGMMARELPSAGGVSAWAQHTLGDNIGRWIGLNTALYYLLTVFFPPIVFGQLCVELVSMVNPEFAQQAGTAIWCAGVLLSIVIAGFSAYRGVVVSSKLAFVMLLVQLVVMTALAAHFLILAITSGTFTWAPFTPGASAGGWSGILLSIPLAMLALVCDAAVPASEETRDAKRTIPLAIMLTLIFVGAWNVLAFGALSMAAPADELIALNANTMGNPVPALANRVWGSMKVLVTLVGMIAMIGALVPCSTAASRLLYSLGRNSTLPAWLSRIHPRYQTPWNGLHVVFALTVLAVIPPGLGLGPTATIGWWGSIVAWFILVVYFCANLCNIVYYRRCAPIKFNPLWNLICPLLAMLIQVLVLWQVVIRELWRAQWTGRSAQLFILISLAGTAVYTLLRRPTLPDAHKERLRSTTAEPKPSGTAAAGAVGGADSAA